MFGYSANPFLKSHLNIEDNLLLFDLLRQGNESAFEKIYKQYWAELYNAAYKRLPEKEKCQDIIQNVFTDLWTRRATLTIENPSAFLHTAVRFQVLKQISRGSKKNFLSESLSELVSPLESDGELLEKEAKSLVALYISALPPKRRNIFVLHYMEGLSTAKIAVQLNVSQKTVQNQLTTASQGLKFKLTHMLLLFLTFFALLFKQ